MGVLLDGFSQTEHTHISCSQLKKQNIISPPGSLLYPLRLTSPREMSNPTANGIALFILLLNSVHVDLYRAHFSVTGFFCSALCL